MYAARYVFVIQSTSILNIFRRTDATLMELVLVGLDDGAERSSAVG